MRTADFNFSLPPELIAQHPVSRRDQSRLLVLDRGNGQIAHRHFRDLPDYLRAGDVLVLNDSRVIAARLRGRNLKTGGNFEMLLLRENALNDWWTLMRPGKRAQPGTRIDVLDARKKSSGIIADVREINCQGHRRLVFGGTKNILTDLETAGTTPLPPYIQRLRPAAADRRRYQTVYARWPGSVAAPTAGLHFTRALLDRIRARGVRVCFVTLHVGPGTFAPVKVNSLGAHVMHGESFEIGPETAAIISGVKTKCSDAAGTADGTAPKTRPPRIIAVGTTTLRVLESVAQNHGGRIVAGRGTTEIFIYPPFQFQIADALVTNFHLPFSTLLMLVSAFAAPGGPGGRELILRTYQEAIRQRYRFFSYGDAMLVGEGWSSGWTRKQRRALFRALI
jgi:S-adenosylmethionine:tRNA ribosyltransferase-isomerase